MFIEQEDAVSVPYLDFAATTPVDARVASLVMHFMTEEYGNAGSRTHEYGIRAKQAVETARAQVAGVVSARSEEVVFTSGATESDNLAILGLTQFGLETGRTHVISTQLEHKAVLEPLQEMEARGFHVDLLPPTAEGFLDPEALAEALRPDTLLVSTMQVNNETGIIQPIEQIAELLRDHPAYFHVDAAQGFGKELDALQHRRIDLISVSGHKIYAPKGIGALITRRRGRDRPPLRPLMFGGGQERGLRPGTVPVPLVAGLGFASELALNEHDQRQRRSVAIRREMFQALEPLHPISIGDQARAVPHIASLVVPGLDSEAAMILMRDSAALSNGSACTAASYEPSHVLESMGLEPDLISGAIRFSWSHLSDPDWGAVLACLQRV